MKKVIIMISTSLLMISCQTDELETLKTEKAELETTITTSTTRLNEVNELIKELSEDETIDYADVTVVKISQEKFEHFIKIQGVIETDNMAMVVPEVGGIITSMNVKEGERISAGSVIATFDSRNIASSKEELLAQMDLAIIMRDKQQKLYDQGLGNIIQLEQAKGQVTTLEKALNSLQVQGSKFSVKAPFSGIVETVYLVKGQLAGPTTPIIMLVGEEDRKVVAKVSETYLNSLTEGADVKVEFPVLNEEIDSLSVSRIGGYVDPVNRTIDLEVNLKKPFSPKYVPNLMANIKVRDKVVENALLVPTKVILKGANQSSHVMILNVSPENSNDSIQRYEVQKREIEIGDMYDGKTIITKGLKVGDIVIDRGRADVNEGNIVEISEL